MKWSLLTGVSGASMLLLILGGVQSGAGNSLQPGQVPPEVRLEGKTGGRVDGSPFSTRILRGKIWYMVYVDPDKRDYNEYLNQELKKRQYPDAYFGSVAVVNMAATWIPNFLLEKMLQEKQEEYPRTIYVLDYEKVFVKSWGLKDDNYNILVFDAEGRLQYWGWGDLSRDQADRVLRLIDQLVKSLQARTPNPTR